VVTKTPGIYELLGLDPFTPHDLRRTAATWARRVVSKISLCLDHRFTSEKWHRIAACDQL
jgi:integrase